MRAAVYDLEGKVSGFAARMQAQVLTCAKLSQMLGESAFLEE